MTLVDGGRSDSSTSTDSVESPNFDGWSGWTVAWWGIGALLGAVRLFDNSFFTHLATGRLILGGSIPHTDPYTFTASGRPWVVQSWLASLFDASIERVVGLGGIRVFQGLCVGTILALLWRLSKPADRLISRFIVMIASGIVGFIWWNERPQMLAFVFMASVLVLVVDRRPSWWLVPMFLVWVNWHGSWLIGLVVVAGAAFARELGDSTTPRRCVSAALVSGRATLAALGACVVGAAISPYGFDLLAFPFRLAAVSSNIAYLGEWYRPELLSLDTAGVMVLAVVGIAGLIRSRQWGWVPLMVTLGVLSVTAVRNLPIAAIVLVPIASLGVPLVGTLRSGPELGWRSAARVAAAVTLAVSVLVAFSAPHIVLEGFPSQVVEELAARGWVANPAERIVAPDAVGNYLELRDGAAAHVFVDDRAEVFPSDVFADHANLVWDRGDWRAVLDRYDATVVIWAEDEELTGHLVGDPAWLEVSRSGGFVGFCRIGRAVGC